MESIFAKIPDLGEKISRVWSNVKKFNGHGTVSSMKKKFYGLELFRITLVTITNI